MSAIQNYEIDFVKRTKEILQNGYENFKGKGQEVTFLLNCLLGLIVTISENEKRKRTVFKGDIDDKFLALIPEKVGFIDMKKISDDLTELGLTELSFDVRHKNDLLGKDKLWFINKLRNGIAHQNIEGVNEGDLWTGVRLWNTNNSQKDFEIIFTVKELKDIAIEFSKSYLNFIEENSKSVDNTHG